MERFCVYTNKLKDKNNAYAEKIAKILEHHGKSCVILTGEDEETVPADVDCMLVLGGDGTMLRASRKLLDGPSIPVLGINLGTLGFLTEVEKDDIEEAIEQLLKGDAEVEERMMLSGTVLRKNGESVQAIALNDAVIGKKELQQILDYSIYVNGKLLYRYSADGVIITTPTGSTGYNMSAGGPIVEPAAKLLVLTPICAHTLNQRSIILSGDDVVEVEINEGRDGNSQSARVSFDGSYVELGTGDRVRIVRSERVTKILKLGKAGFLEVLHQKMTAY